MIRTVTMIAAALAVQVPAAVRAKPAVEPASLRIAGGELAMPAAQGDGLRVFKGIPYAAPPVGELRWRPTAPLPAWKGVRSSDEFGADCPQPVGDASPASRPKAEDCLYLNVWTPGLKGQRRPVFVWIHGGGSQFGSGAQPVFDGSVLARRGIVVVTINYRLGALGFLSSSALSAESGYGASGNYGFMDQIAALKWVQANIAKFGGDPARVTIGGESSGSVSTGTLMASPLARGLFAGVIGESGSVMRAVGEGSMGADALAPEEAKGALLQQQMGAASLEQMRAAPAADVLAAAGRLFPRYFYNIPVVDGHVLPDAPWRIFAAHRQNDVPLLIGTNSGEGSMQLMFDRRPRTVPGEIATYYGRLADEVAPLYPTAAPDDIATVLAVIGDYSFGYPAWKWAWSQASQGKAPTFLYRFDWAPRVPQGAFGKDFDVRLAGAFHGAEVPYVFDTLTTQKGWTLDADDRRVVQAVTGYWANFIRTGNPNGEGLARWPRYDASEAPVRMTLGPNPRAGTDPDYIKYRALLDVNRRLGVTDPAAPSRNAAR